jgi:hypothetical protein
VVGLAVLAQRLAHGRKPQSGHVAPVHLSRRAASRIEVVAMSLRPGVPLEVAVGSFVFLFERQAITVVGQRVTAMAGSRDSSRPGGWAV